MELVDFRKKLLVLLHAVLEEKQAIGKVCFVVSGEFLTSHARCLVLEGNWRDAVKFLVESVDGMDWNTTFDILSGKMRLTEDPSGTLILEKDSRMSCKAYLEETEEVYGGCYKYKGRWYEPYACVDCYGQPDFSFISRKGVDCCGQPDFSFINRKGVAEEPLSDEFGLEAKHKRREPMVLGNGGRALYYADDIYRDEVFDLCVGDGIGEWVRAVLFHRVNEPPIWMPSSTRAQQALDSYLNSGRKLQIRGYRPDPRQVEDPLARKGFAPALCVEYDFKGLQVEILKQNKLLGGKFFKIGKLKIPYAPFEAYAMRRYDRIEMSKWVPVSHSGIKIYGDDPYHSDWVIGAGLTSENYEKETKKQSEGIYDKLEKIQRDLYNYHCLVLLGRGKASGSIYFPEETGSGDGIAVIPSLDPKFLPLVIMARGIITEAGGKMAHLVSVMKEREMPIVRMKNACSRLEGFQSAIIDCDEGRVVLKGKGGYLLAYG